MLGLAAALVVLSATPAAAAELAVAPGGSDWGPCDVFAPCTPEHAVNDVARGSDEVVIQPGTYVLRTPLAAREQVVVRGVPGEAKPVLSSDGSGSVIVPVGNDGGAMVEKRTLSLMGTASASHLTLRHSGERGIALAFDGGSTASSITAIASGDYGRAVFVDGSSNTALLRDSFAFASGGAATAIFSYRPLMKLRNVLAVAPYISGDALDISGGGHCYYFSCPGATPAKVDSRNSIFRGALADVAMTASYSGSTATFAVDHSNFRTDKLAGSYGSGARLDDRGDNQSADPVFLSSQTGDYRPAPGSPTIDAGVYDDDLGTVDLAGAARAQGTAVDIGPFEYAPPPVVTDPTPSNQQPQQPATQQPAAPQPVNQQPTGSAGNTPSAPAPPSPTLAPPAIASMAPSATKKPLSRAAQLATALKSCKKVKNRRKRSKCVRAANKTYGAKNKATK